MGESGVRPAVREPAAADRGSESAGAGRQAGDIVCGALAVAIAVAVGLHVYAAGRLDPVTGTISDYVSVPGAAGPLTLAVMAIAVATGALAVALAHSSLPNPILPCVVLGVAGLGLIAAIAFPTNLPGAPVSADTVLHRFAAGIFFVALPLAGLLVLRRRSDRAARRMTVLSMTTGLAFVVSHVPLVLPGFPGAHLIGTLLPRGLAERALLASELGLLATLALANRRVAR